jgi:hypothetical protein
MTRTSSLRPTRALDGGRSSCFRYATGGEMIYRSRFILFLSFTLIIYCAPSIRSADTKNLPLYVKYGTDGGRCAGYCKSEMTFKPGLLECLDESPSNPEGYPPKSKRFPLSDRDWHEITRTISYHDLVSLPERIGCPGCADEGLEWVEIKESGTESKRVAFSYHRSPPNLEPGLKVLRRLSEQCKKSSD